ncbi:MAG: HAD family hydrolase [Firmicutes bacterium]|jgi:hypothetical protein|nr:HAD family hydrolase [Bacillota bacterium]
MKNRKIIFLDIDGTFTVPLEKPTPLAIEAVRKARENGHKVLLCTGRNMPIISKDILKVGFDGVVASAGSHIEVDEKVIFDSLLAEEDVQECMDILHKFGVYCRIEDPYGMYMDLEMEKLVKKAVPNKTNSELIRMKKELETGVGIQPYSKYSKMGAYKVCFICMDLKDIEKTKPYLESRFNYVIHPYAADAVSFNGELIRKGMDKGEGMERVCQYYGAEMSDTIAFGDSMNDYQMFICAGTAVAMGNACKELKQIANSICENVENDGIYYELKRMELI